ncbi:MAG: hypothetical protein ACFFFH_15425, partial [Candidatus Thorarchaeota archaeon]
MTSVIGVASWFFFQQIHPIAAFRNGLPAAIQTYRQAVNLAPRSLTPRVALAQTYLADKRPTAAIT